MLVMTFSIINIQLYKVGLSVEIERENLLTAITLSQYSAIS